MNTPEPLAYSVADACRVSSIGRTRLYQLDTRNNRDFGDALIRAVFDEVSVGI